MSENLIIKGDSKKELYENLLPQIKALVEGENDMIANMANVAACLKDTFNFWWVGFYRVINDELVLGPFQGKPACVRLTIGKGVCGTAVERDETVVVKDVHEFAGHIACDSASLSEIVVPLHDKSGKIFGVLDIDSPLLNRFESIEDIIVATARKIEKALNI